METSTKDEKISESDADDREMLLLPISELDDPNLNIQRGDESKDSDSDEAEADAEAPEATIVKKRRYPYAPLFFIMAAATGQGCA
jgi:hypothetical protein